MTSKGEKCVTLSLIFKFKPVGFDNEQFISHQKPINSWVAKALLSLYILCKIWILKVQLLSNYMVHSSQVFRNSSLCSTLWIVSADFLADRLEKGWDYANKAKNLNQDSPTVYEESTRHHHNSTFCFMSSLVSSWIYCSVFSKTSLKTVWNIVKYTKLLVNFYVSSLGLKGISTNITKEQTHSLKLTDNTLAFK